MSLRTTKGDRFTCAREAGWVSEGTGGLCLMNAFGSHLSNNKASWIRTVLVRLDAVSRCALIR